MAHSQLPSAELDVSMGGGVRVTTMNNFLVQKIQFQTKRIENRKLKKQN